MILDDWFITSLINNRVDPLMGESQELPLPPHYLHQLETRSEREITLTNKLAAALSELNLKRVQQKSIQPKQADKPGRKFFFVCISGIPPFEGQFQSLDLPGEKVVMAFSGLKGDYTEQQYLEIFEKSGFEHEAHKIRREIELRGNQGYTFVAVYHSFGSFSLATYLRLYGTDHKIEGFVDIGGPPLRFYPILIKILKANHHITHQYLLQNAQEMHEKLVNDPDRVKAGFIPYRNKYQSILYFKLVTSPCIRNIFALFRQFPRCLRLFIYGSRDRIFPEQLVNEKPIHYSYGRPLDPGYEARLQECYRQYYGAECENVQTRFIFRLDGGSHSIHMQPKFQPILREIIRQYLDLLQAALSN